MTEQQKTSEPAVTEAAQVQSAQPEQPEQGFMSAAGFADAESREILNLLGQGESGASCCGGSCCA